MEDFFETFGRQYSGADAGLQIAIAVVGCLIILASIAALVISICLAIKYVKFNKKKCSCGKTGQDIARKVLDDNGLQHIKVKCSGSFLFGNSYSHYFKKVRLRRRTWKKDSVTSLAMATQKSCLAVLDKENDPDMRQRVKFTPIIYLGPLACVPLILIGVAIDMLLLNGRGIVSTIAIILGLAFYAVSFVFSIKVLKTEKKAQERALVIAKESGLANDGEIEDMKTLFKLYNIEYVNDMIIALLELIYRILQIIAILQGNSSSSRSK